MSAPAWTKGPWRANLHHTMKQGGRTYGFVHPPNDIVPVAVVALGVEGMPEDAGRANARLIAAAPDLAEAAALQDAAEEAHANCPECEGEIMPELCPTCFPLFDDARTKRWAALAKARGEPQPPSPAPSARSAAR